MKAEVLPAVSSTPLSGAGREDTGWSKTSTPLGLYRIHLEAKVAYCLLCSFPWPLIRFPR